MDGEALAVSVALVGLDGRWWCWQWQCLLWVARVLGGVVAGLGEALSSADEVGGVGLDDGLEGLPKVCGCLGRRECWVVRREGAYEGNGGFTRSPEVFQC